MRRKLTSPEYLAVFVSVVAILLSQLPPLHTLFNKARPSITVNNWATVSHVLGRPLIMLPITISNEGSRVYSVDFIECTLVHVATGEEWRFEVISHIDQTSVQPFQPVREIPFGRFKVTPERPWSETIHCATPPSPQQVSFYHALRIEMETTLQTMFAARQTQTQERIELPEETWLPASEEMARNFNLLAGQYELRVSAGSFDAGPVAQDQRTIELNQSDIQVLMRHVDEFKFGVGVLFPVSNNLMISKVVSE